MRMQIQSAWLSNGSWCQAGRQTGSITAPCLCDVDLQHCSADQLLAVGRKPALKHARANNQSARFVAGPGQFLTNVRFELSCVSMHAMHGPGGGGLASTAVGTHQMSLRGLFLPSSSFE